MRTRNKDEEKSHTVVKNEEKIKETNIKMKED
jgi:hypothetical protein